MSTSVGLTRAGGLRCSRCAIVDFSYGNVQVLFGVDLEVHKGEVLALLGTNGAGKSSILRVIAGLGTPSHGRGPPQRADDHLRVSATSGGHGHAPSSGGQGRLSFHDGLGEPRDGRLPVPPRSRRAPTTDRAVLDLFPVLAGEDGSGPRPTLSGGQQQMLGLARVLLHDPEVLLIDELSLGLAPILVQELLGVIEQLRAEGLTIVIVEQSVSVALSIADRAVFLEKGRVRFEGPAQELAGAGRPGACRVPRGGRGLTVSWITPQITANGVVAGLVVGLLAMGIVLVYRATGVINFAVGNIGVIGATLLAVLVVRYDVPFWARCRCPSSPGWPWPVSPSWPSFADCSRTPGDRPRGHNRTGPVGLGRVDGTSIAQRLQRSLPGASRGRRCTCRESSLSGARALHHRDGPDRGVRSGLVLEPNDRRQDSPGLGG